MAAKLQPGEVLLLENTRFHPGEKENSPEMAQALASLADVYVNDAFGTAHRSHASTVGVASFLPSAAGFLLEKEIKYLGKAVADPERPFVVILGGAKVSGKIEVFHTLLGKADKILVGGGMANTFFAAGGMKMGDSLVEDDALESARGIIEHGQGKIHLPGDFVIADGFSADAARRLIDAGDVPAGWRVMDIGPGTIESYARILNSAAVIVWNGPMGVFEFEPFAEGTFKLAEAVANSGAVSIIGGGDSAAAAHQSGLADQFTHISTGGGASLEMLKGKALPGLEALDNKI
jgi:phosphoglycerate kinase